MAEKSGQSAKADQPAKAAGSRNALLSAAEKEASERMESARVIADYNSALNAVTKSSTSVSCSYYFVSRWMPLLGGNGTMIVLALRSLGYSNKKTGEKRDGIPIDLPELAKLAGCSVPTVKREFSIDPVTHQPRNPALHLFVKREKQYRRHPVTNQLLREENIYRVMLDEPLHDDDLPRLQEELDRREKAFSGGEPRKAQNEPNENQAARATKSGKAHFEPNAQSRMAQNESLKSQSESGSIQNESDQSQNEPALIPESSSIKPLGDSSCASGAGLSLSLFTDPDLPKTCATALKLDAMTVPPSKFDADWMRRKLTLEALSPQIHADPRILPALRRNWQKLPERIQDEIQGIVYEADAAEPAGEGSGTVLDLEL